MYDIKIFIEDDWNFWWRINAWKEIIYWVWKNKNELINSLRKGLDLAFENKRKTNFIHKISSFLSFNEKKKHAIKL